MPREPNAPYLRNMPESVDINKAADGFGALASRFGLGVPGLSLQDFRSWGGVQFLVRNV